ncbi:ethanolamine utilization microcompartment protein EutL [Propionibacterium australiense]|uniref:Microcompartment protein EutL n=1 Tax=Propionibacterium australiense TaxID=119981 RepID=A0A383S841_9ACTN|nr:ethanolamine utilization microcompartment protein EutL [Propionibacterium australiense]RLP10937.1 microcompartment protein EutL [Propionibacterium australiense]RLP13096.1 microcompartment protein EutL [Propionibacterium australiense]SYZ33891.1 Microcompartment protein, bacteria [Propionibacterium australiense]VEH90892.1 Ethanolamine utilization protein EutL [Propionibacterium australiense]
MAILDPVKPNILATKVIANVDRGFAEKLNLRPDQRSIAIVTCDIDDALYTALDEATKFAEVEVVYAKSFYAGSGYPSGPLSGEIIGILAGPNPAEARSGLDACISYAEQEAWFYSADETGDLTFFPHLISSTGSYLSAQAGIPQGQPLAYLIAPPLEATYALDLALKAAEVEMRVWYEPPSETNFSGGLLTGSQSACQAACAAFQQAVLDVAANPRQY